MTTYNPSVHAVERIRERFGIMEEHAKNFVNQLMVVAKYVTTQPDGKVVYKHAGRDAMLVVDERSNTIVTVLPPAKTQVNVTNPFYKEVTSVVRRQLTKAQRQFTREFRQLSESQALVQIEIAQLTLNKARAKNPKTQATIQANIDAALSLFDEYGVALGELQAEFERTKREADAFLTV